MAEWEVGVEGGQVRLECACMCVCVGFRMIKKRGNPLSLAHFQLDLIS